MKGFIASSVAFICWILLFLYVFMPIKTSSDILDFLLIPVFWIVSIIICITVATIVEDILSRITSCFAKKSNSVDSPKMTQQPPFNENYNVHNNINESSMACNSASHETYIPQTTSSQIQPKDYYQKRKNISKGYWKVTPQQIRAMDWREFESFVADILSEQGYKTILTPAQKDEGKDIVAEKDGKKYFIECKHWKEGSSVGREYLQKLVGAAAGCSVTNVIFIATCSFHDNAKVYAKEINASKMFHLELWNMNKLLKIANSIPESSYKEQNLFN
jgi:HJR/Mrr/RecB family endonuclease